MHNQGILCFIIFYVILLHHVKNVLPEEYGDTITKHFKNSNQQSQSPFVVCPRNGACVPKVQCPAHVRPGSYNPDCYLPKQIVGVCCYTGSRHAGEMDLIMHMREGNLNVEDLKAANKTSKRKLSKWLEKADILASLTETTVDENSPSFGHHLSLVNYDAKIPVLGNGALQNLYATKELKSREAILTEELNLGLTQHTNSPFCPEEPVCFEEINRYRTVDGVCNNPKYPKWGAANSAYQRLLPPAFHDGTWSMRRSVKNKPLASPRVISRLVFDDKSRHSSALNLMFMQFGQFIAHDVSATVMFTIGNGSSISCCTKNGEEMLPVEKRHYACAPIYVDHADDFYGQFNQRCLNFVRAQLAPSSDCKIGYGNPMNGATHFLDLSHLYGTTMKKVMELRGPKGELKVFNDYGRHMPPLTHRKECVNMQEDSVCFNSGDHHGNQVISLTILHTIWTREHNRIARELLRMNPNMDEDVVFMEARRIVQAEYQHIVYNEWSPLLLGPSNMELFDLEPTQKGYAKGYDPEVDPSITTEFGSAAMRFGHSTVDGKIMALSYHKRQMIEAVRLPEVMFQPNRLRIKNYLDSMLVGLTWQPMQEADVFIDDALTKYLFHGVKPFGLDLAAINIQRSRDFGIRPYNDYRRLVGLQPILDFGDHHEEDSYMGYDDPDDVDLFVGGLSEPRISGGVVGPTFAAIIADQFSRLKKGDRYYYEYGPSVNPGAFTLSQLHEIRKVTLARVLCDNSDGLEFVHQALYSFLRTDHSGNPSIHCRGDRNLPEMDLSKFITQPRDTV
ncbi:chorion peroxidase [Aricia agestis]|uniref:chorion peroxidase n=1 Tax=Aricia agestis TaxID=91739 RepID=UPI001C20B683|nr:chorion peroxidase [Aricia agestis]